MPAVHMRCQGFLAKPDKTIPVTDDVKPRSCSFWRCSGYRVSRGPNATAFMYIRPVKSVAAAVMVPVASGPGNSTDVQYS
jgi:hypothetical protein